jgi:hypothetical protein
MGGEQSKPAQSMDETIREVRCPCHCLLPAAAPRSWLLLCLVLLPLF